MRKLIIYSLVGVFLVVCLFTTVSPAQAVNTSIDLNIDGVSVKSGVKAETQNNRVMVPLRVISENMGGYVMWSGKVITLKKDDVKISLTLDNTTAFKNGVKFTLDAKPYVKNNRVMVPLRFLSEAYGAQIGYKDNVVAIQTEPFKLDGVKVKTLEYENAMVVGSMWYHINGNIHMSRAYNILKENAKREISPPEEHGVKFASFASGGYYELLNVYHFLDEEENDIESFLLYSKVKNSFYDEPEYLMKTSNEGKWYNISKESVVDLNGVIYKARQNGFEKYISSDV